MKERAGMDLEILIVEDAVSDPILVEEAMREANLPAPKLIVARDGGEALARLRRQGPYANARRPDLILLDIHLPQLDGYSVLEDLKSDPELRRIPVVVFSTSAADEAVLGSYDRHANCYITKPVDMMGFIRVMKAIHHFWLNTVRLPHR